MKRLRDHIYPELIAIITHWLIWFSLAMRDIKMRYRRSSIGPFWITISTAITISSMGFLYSKLFHADLDYYLPYLASGIIGWSFISSLLTESGQAYIESENYLRNQSSFLSIYSMRIIIRNIIIFMHNLVVFIPIGLFFKTGVNLNLLLLIPSVFLICCNAVFYGSILAIIGTRYRDFAQLVNNVIQVIFFMTPIMWMPNSLPGQTQWIVQYNPFNHFLNLIRSPLLGQHFSYNNFVVTSCITLIGFILYCMYLPRYRQRIVFWL